MSNRVHLRLAYQKGQRAREMGDSHLDSPYRFDQDLPEHDAWLRGWAGQPHEAVAPQFTTTTHTRRIVS